MRACVTRILEAASLAQLRARVNGDTPHLLRPALLAEYDRLYRYRNIEEWNRLVRVCEALALVGWGEREPVEARAERWVNGSWYTTLLTRDFQKLPGHGNTVAESREAEWSKRGASFVLRGGEDQRDRGVARLATQRLPLPKNPLRIHRTVANHQRSATAFVNALEELRVRLDRELVSSRYGDDFDYVAIGCSFSNHDDPHETVRWEYFHDQKDVPKRLPWRPYVRPRLGFGKLTRKDDLWQWRVVRHFTRAEGELPLDEQKRRFGEDLGSILEALAERLAKKKVQYDIQHLRTDLEALIASW